MALVSPNNNHHHHRKEGPPSPTTTTKHPQEPPRSDLSNMVRPGEKDPESLGVVAAEETLNEDPKEEQQQQNHEPQQPQPGNPIIERPQNPCKIVCQWFLFGVALWSGPIFIALHLDGTLAHEVYWVLALLLLFLGNVLSLRVLFFSWTRGYIAICHILLIVVQWLLTLHLKYPTVDRLGAYALLFLFFANLVWFQGLYEDNTIHDRATTVTILVIGNQHRITLQETTTRVAEFSPTTRLWWNLQLID